MQAIYDIAEICFKKQMEDVVICPGSRSAPLTIAFARHPGFKPIVISDERSAGFISIGLSQISKKSTVIVCTSGSASYNLAPAVAEAFYQQVPLIIFTADRPPEWIDQMDGQTIRQHEIFGKHVKGSYSLPLSDGHPDTVWHIHRIVSEALNQSMWLPQGPVHINVPLREPLYPKGDIHFDSGVKTIKALASNNNLSAEIWDDISLQFCNFNRILLLPGQQGMNRTLVKAVQEFSKHLGAVVIDDIVSNFHQLPEAIRMHDSILSGTDKQLKSLEPDLLVTFGGAVVSKTLKKFLRQIPTLQHWHLQSAGYAADTYQHLSTVLPIEPLHFFETLLQVVSSRPLPHAFQTLWKNKEKEIKEKVDVFFHQNYEFNEFQAIRQIVNALPGNSLLHLSNSMPVRYVNALGIDADKNIEVFANRGTSGIDGVLSTAVGCAMKTNKIVTLIIGDMAFFYDRNAFWNSHIPKNLRVILINNHGGGIFRMIDGSGQQAELEKYFETWQPLTAVYLAKEYGFPYLQCTSYEAIANALLTFFDAYHLPKILEIETNGHHNKSVYDDFKNTMVNL